MFLFTHNKLTAAGQLIAGCRADTHNAKDEQGEERRDTILLAFFVVDEEKSKTKICETWQHCTTFYAAARASSRYVCAIGVGTVVILQLSIFAL